MLYETNISRFVPKKGETRKKHTSSPPENQRFHRANQPFLPCPYSKK